MRATKWIAGLAVVAGLSLGCISSATADVSVNGYYRSNGTYVAPHWRSNPDGVRANNFSYPGNLNPYTGRTAPGNSFGYGLPAAPPITQPRYYGSPGMRVR